MMKFNKTTMDLLKARALNEELAKTVPFASKRSTWFFQLPTDETLRENFLRNVRIKPCLSKK